MGKAKDSTTKIATTRKPEKARGRGGGESTALLNIRVSEAHEPQASRSFFSSALCNASLWSSSKLVRPLPTLKCRRRRRQAGRPRLRPCSGRRLRTASSARAAASPRRFPVFAARRSSTAASQSAGPGPSRLRAPARKLPPSRLRPSVTLTRATRSLCSTQSHSTGRAVRSPACQVPEPRGQRGQRGPRCRAGQSR